uniref:SydA n=2 Tax=Aspergillus versicolor TaxID=46472 RepID=UPI003CC922A9
EDVRFMVSLSEYGAILSRFFEKIDFHLPKPYYDSSIEPALAKYIEEQPWSEDLKTRAAKYAKQAVGIASWYPRASFAVRFNCVVITLLVIIYDEDYLTFGDAGTEFSLRLVRGLPQKAPFLDSLAQFLQNTDQYLGPYGSSMVIKTTLEFVEGTNVENDFSEAVPPDALRFPRYLRVKTGFAETYAHAIFPNDTFPEHKYRKLYLPALSPLCDIIDFTNDILSFYKETIRGTERINYICNVANTTGSSALRCLQETVDAVESRVLEIHRILAPYPDLLAHCNDYLAAYIGWHIRTTSRYFLDEVRFMAWVNVTELVA